MEHITCGLTSIAAPIDNVEEVVNDLSDMNPRTRKTGFQQQFEVYCSCVSVRFIVFIGLQNLAKNTCKVQDFTYIAARSPNNQDKNRLDTLLPRKKHKLYYHFILIIHC